MVVLLVVVLLVLMVFLLSVLPATRYWLPATDKTATTGCGYRLKDAG